MSTTTTTTNTKTKDPQPKKAEDTAASAAPAVLRGVSDEAINEYAKRLEERRENHWNDYSLGMRRKADFPEIPGFYTCIIPAEPNEISEKMRAGFLPVYEEEISFSGESVTGTPSQMGTIKRITLQAGLDGILMKLPIHIWERIQAEEQRLNVDAIENAIKRKNLRDQEFEGAAYDPAVQSQELFRQVMSQVAEQRMMTR